MRNDAALITELEKLLAQRIGLHITARDRFMALVRERAAAHDCTTLTEYRDLLRGNQADPEWETLVRAFTSSETFFFRDQGQFDLLRLRLLPELIARHSADKTLRLWSAGCASGEEAYTLAMLVDMLLPEQDGWNILLIGTDIDSAAIAKARLGCYGQWSFRMVPDEIKQRYFTSQSAFGTPQSLVLDERIRSRVTFRVANLLSEPDAQLHDMDLILCRNVFIYFDPAAVSAVANRLAGALRAGGYLMTAHTELIGHTPRELESRLFAEGLVYQRLQSAIRRSETGAPGKTPAAAIRNQYLSPAPAPVAKNGEGMLKEATAQAERGEFDLAEQTCHQILCAFPLMAEAYLLLAQLASVKGDSSQEKALLNKAIYLDDHFVAAYMCNVPQ